MTEPIELTDEFTNPVGEWTDYNVIPLTQEEGLRKQHHVDIRSFVPDQPATKVRMFDMDRFSISVMDNKQLALFSSNELPPAHIIVVNNEGWTYGKVGPQEDRNNWNGISFECNAEVTTATQSIITQA